MNETLLRSLVENLRAALWYWQVNTPLEQRGPTERDDMASAEDCLHAAEEQLRLTTVATVSCTAEGRAARAGDEPAKRCPACSGAGGYLARPGEGIGMRICARCGGTGIEQPAAHAGTKLEC